MATVFQIYSTSLRFGRLVGVIPSDFKLPYEPAVVEKRSLFIKILNKLLNIFQALFVGYCITHFLFLVYRGIVVLPKLIAGDTSSTLEAYGWIISSLLPWLTVAMLHTHKQPLERIALELHHMETRLIKRFVEHPLHRQRVLDRMKAEKRVYYVLILIETLGILILPTLAVLNGMHSPRVEGYIYTMVDEKTEIYWLWVLSFCGQGVYTLGGSICRLVGQTSRLSVIQSANLCIDLMALTPSSSTERLEIKKHIAGQILRPSAIIIIEPVPRSHSIEFSTAVDEYKKLRRIIQDFNKVHTWSLFFYMGLTLILCTVLLYYPSRSTLSNGRQQYYMLCYSCVLVILFRTFIVLHPMGRFRGVLERFTDNWRRYLACNGQLSDKNIAVLHSCAPHGLTVGEFYTVKPLTILTFYYLLLSYVIFVYQI